MNFHDFMASGTIGICLTLAKVVSSLSFAAELSLDAWCFSRVVM